MFRRIIVSPKTALHGTGAHGGDTTGGTAELINTAALYSTARGHTRSLPLLSFTTVLARLQGELASRSGISMHQDPRCNHPGPYIKRTLESFVFIGCHILVQVYGNRIWATIDIYKYINRLCFSAHKSLNDKKNKDL